ncbi:hypothetical protein OROMI_016084 [Orobanche minor]
MEKSSPTFDNDDLHLSLGLPGRERDESEQPSSSSQAKNNNNKRSSQLQIDESAAPPPKAQVVGWPPVRSSRRNAVEQMYVKVSMDGAPYLRKIGLKFYRNYSDLLEFKKRSWKHQWESHGSGTGMTPNAYFWTVLDVYHSILGFGIDIKAGAHMKASEIKAELEKKLKSMKFSAYKRADEGMSDDGMFYFKELKVCIHGSSYRRYRLSIL